MTQRDEFDTAGAYVAMKDLLGELVLFTPTEHVDEVQTDFGTKDAIITDLVVLTQEGQPEHNGVMVFQGSLIGALKRKIPVPANPARGIVGREGRKLLGVLAMGEEKKGQSAPYVLTAPTEEQKQVARDFLAGRVIEQATAPESDDPFAVRP
jgi:hypothetical protein